MTVKVTSKGQITLPKTIRNKLEIEPGDVVEFELAPGSRVVLFKADPAARPNQLDAIVGSAGEGPSTDELMALLRGDD